MSKPKFYSLFEIKDAFKKKEHDPKTIMKGSISFLHQAVKARDQSVKQFLITLAKTPTTSHKERFARARAIAWLKRYQDPNLLPLLVDLLLETEGMCQHEVILALVELKDLRAAGPLAALLNGENSPRDIDFLLNALAATGAAEYLDFIASYLSDENHIIRVGAITSLLHLGALTDRKEVIETILPYLKDPEQYVRSKTAYHLNMHFPNEFYDRGLEGYLPEALRFPRQPEAAVEKSVSASESVAGLPVGVVQVRSVNGRQRVPSVA